MPSPITWEQWQDKAKKAYQKGVYTKKEMVRDWGFPSDLDPEKDYILFDKGKPYIQDYQKRLERKRNSSRTRSARNVTSTNLADHLNKVQSKEQRRILDESSMFALDDPELSMMVEHGVPVSQYHQILEEGAPDDPSNKYIQRTVDGIAKTDAEKVLRDRGLDKQFIVIDHEDFDQPPRLVPVNSYNPHDFPSKQGVPIDNLDDLKTKLTSKHGQVRFNTNKAISGYFGVEPVTAAGTVGLKLIRENPLGAIAGAGSLVEPEAVKSALQGDYKEAATQTATGALIGAGTQQLAKMAVQLVPKAGSVVLAPLMAAAAPVTAAVGAVQMLDAVVEGATGKNLQETGIAAEQTKQELKNNGYNGHQLRKYYRNGNGRPVKAS